MDDKRTKDLGELIARRMMERNPKLIKDVRRLVADKLGYNKPWYLRVYESIRGYFK